MTYTNGPVTIRPSKFYDTLAFTDRLRPEDEDELSIFGYPDAESALKFGYLQSLETYTILYKGVQVAMYGLNPRTLLGSDANIWFLGTPEMCHIKKTFMKMSRLCIGEWLNKYPVLWNIVPVNYTKSLRWLEWLGANINALNGGKYNIISFVR